MKAFILALALLAMGAGINAWANGPTVKLDEPLNQMPQKQQEQISLDRQTLKTVQKELTSRGYSTGQIDGIYGPRTERALLKFQAAQGLALTGQLNQETMDALNIPEETKGLGSRPVKKIQAQEESKDSGSQTHQTTD